MAVTQPTTKTPPGGDGGMGPLNGGSRSNTAKLQSAFGGSPMGTEGLDAEQIKQYYYTLLSQVGSNEANSNTSFAQTPVLNFAGAPVIADVQTGPGGKPGTPYTPNIASAPNGNYTEMPDPPEQMAEEQPNSGYGVGVGSQENPEESSEQQSRFSGDLDPNYQLGKSPYTGQGALRN